MPTSFSLELRPRRASRRPSLPRCAASIDLTGKTAIADLPALLSQCHLFIGNDSGAMHVAAAVGLPVIAVFGPTDPEGTAPVTPRQHRSAKAILQPMFSPQLSDRSPVHDRQSRPTWWRPRHGHAVLDPGAACLSILRCAPPFSSIAMDDHEEVGYLNHTSRFRMFPFVAAAIRRLNEAGLPVIVVTNQSGVGRGYFPESLVHAVNELMTQQLAEKARRSTRSIIVRTPPPKTAAAASQEQAC